MYLIGSCTFPREALRDGSLHLKQNIDKGDLACCKEDGDHIVIDLYTKKYFDAESNRWQDLKIS